MGKFIISEEEKKRIRLLYELGGAQTTSTNVDVSCIGFSGEEYKEITTSLLNSDGAGKPVHIWRVWPDGRAIYVESGDKYKYTYTCSKTKAGVVEITDVESSQMDEYKLFSTTKSTTSTQNQPTIPSELVNSDGVKKFQDWLDLNASDEKLGAGKGWATGFRNGTLKKQGGYGRFGPRTSKAFQSYYKYYKENKPISATNTTANTGTATNSTTTNTQNTYRPSKMMDR